MKGIKFIETLNITFEKSLGDEIIFKSTHFNSQPQTIINETQIELSLKLSKQQILLTISQCISESSAWIIKEVDNHYFNI